MKNCILLFFLILLVIRCDKPPFDLRKKYTGDYAFNVQYKAVTGNGQSYDSSYIYYGKIISGSNENELDIYFSEGVSMEVILYEDLTLEGNYGTSGLTGEFKSSKLVEFFSSYYHPGGHVEYYVEGEKYR